MAAYASSVEHLLAEIARIDLLLAVQALPAAPQPALSERPLDPHERVIADEWKRLAQETKESR